MCTVPLRLAFSLTDSEYEPFPCLTLPFVYISSIPVQFMVEQCIGYLLLFRSKQPAGNITFHVVPDCMYTNN